MKKLKLVIIALFVCGSLFSQTGPDAILPGSSEVPGWRASAAYKIYSYENIRNLIGDEAELFKEFGVRNVITRDYVSFSGRVINIRIFTMNNSFGSYGLFLQKSKGEKVVKDFGNASFEKPGSYVFWKHMYLVMMNSVSQVDTVSAGLKLMAGIIDSKIKSKGAMPEILKLSKESSDEVTIFKGPVGLANIYYFTPLNIFKIDEGIAIYHKDSKEIILKYEDNNVAVRMFSDVAAIFGGMSKFSGFMLSGDYTFIMKDKDDKILTFKVVDNCLDIVIK